MLNLTLHIEYLLLRHDCVVVPGVGAFIAVRHAARYDAERGMWCPMTREVRFNSLLTHDDGLLASSYARRQQLSFQDGRELLRKDIAYLRELLESEGEVTLGQLGTLSLEDGATVFRPMRNPEAMAGLLGFGEAPVAICITDLNCDNKEEETKETVNEPSERHVGRRMFDTHRNYYVAINKQFARIAASFIVVAMMALTFILPQMHRVRVDEASVVPVEKIIRNTAALVSDSDNKAARAEKEEVRELTTANDSVRESSARRYHAIVATFDTRGEAETFAATHGTSRYPLSVLSSRTKSRVSAISGENREEVVRRMAEPDFRATFSETWIWEQ